MLTGIVKGFTSYFTVFSFISKHRLYGYFVISGIISLIIGGAIFGTAYLASDNLGAFFTKLYPFEFGRDYVLSIMNVTAGALVVILGVILYKYLLLIFVSPFMGPLSAKVEAIITGEPTASKFSIKQTSYEIVRGIRISLRNVIRELSILLVLLLLSLIPIFTIFITPLIFLVQAYYAGFSSFDYFLERRANIRQSVQFARKNRGIVIGNGAGFMLLLLIPFLGLFLAPVLSTIAATKTALSTRSHL